MFKLELDALFNRVGETLELDREIDLSDLLPDGNELFPQPGRIRGSIRNTAGVVYSDASLTAELHTVCDRCACDVVRTLKVPLVHTFVTEVENDDTDDFIILPDMVLDLDALAGEDLMLDLPSKVLCKEDCKGLCPQCGKNLNDGPCDCKAPVDPRLAGLLALLDDSGEESDN